MNADRLLALYEKVSEAPDAIAHLRRFVLDLAVRGKLVAQDAGDEPASELLRKASANVSHTKGGRNKEQKVAKRQDLIFEIPSHWEPLFVCQALQELQTGPFGSSLHKSDYRKGGTPVLNPASIQNGQIVPIDGIAVGPATLERLASFKMSINDILMARRGEMGRCAVVTEREAGWLCGTGSLILRPSDALFPEYLALVISSPTGRAFLGGAAVGTTMQNLNQSILLRMPFGLPPLAEQRRIVAKVDELMALLDRLEAARTAREATRDRLTSASLARLTAPDADPADFPANARFALATLPALTTRPDQIKPLRQTILNLAVRGKLVKQDPTDEPASEFLTRIGEAKGAAKGRKGARAKGVPAATESTDTEVPLGWEPVRLEDVAVSMRYGTSIKCDYDEEHAPVLRIPNVSSGQITLDDMKYGPLSEADREALSLEADDLLMIRSNGSLDIVGRPAVVPPEAAGMAFAGYLVRLQTLKEAINSRYIWLALNSSAVRDQIERPIRSAVGLKNVNLTEFGNLFFWLPPLAEQHRIVAKVDALMALCDRLEAALTTADTTRALLLESLLHEALIPTCEVISEAAE